MTPAIFYDANAIAPVAIFAAATDVERGILLADLRARGYNAQGGNGYTDRWGLEYIIALDLRDYRAELARDPAGPLAQRVASEDCVLIVDTRTGAPVASLERGPIGARTLDAETLGEFVSVSQAAVYANGVRQPVLDYTYVNGRYYTIR